MKVTALLGAVSLLAACAAPAPLELPPSHPASTAAPEAPPRPMTTNLANDEASRTTAQLLAPPAGADSSPR